MNNSKIVAENTLVEELGIDKKPVLNQRRQEVTDILEALSHITASSYWKVLEEKVFSGAKGVLEKKLRVEKDSQEICRLQGQLAWMDKYAELSKLTEVYRKELERLNNQL